MSTPVGIVVPNDLPSSEFVRYAREAERLGFAELWVVEDCFLNGGIAQAAVALASTSSIRIGIGILPAGARNVAFASMDISTLAQLFPGRLSIGIGHGMPKWMRQTGTWPASPLTLLGEYVDAMRAILSGSSVSVDGRYVKLQDIQLATAPAIVPPIYAGVRGPKSLAVSGRVADGTILAEPVTPEYLHAVRAQVASPRSQHEFIAYNVAAVDDSIDRARELARQGLVWIGEPDWAPHIAPLPFAEEFARLREAAGSREEFAASLPDEWVDQLAVVGTPVQAKTRLQELAEAGADHLVLMPAGPDPFAMMAALGRVL
jgi:alkanesulfonate monooxygenase SsuD/methylene tetrahydromethanopterin reductase-like flavin-dependent oxidoreductase (luciferase family)